MDIQQVDGYDVVSLANAVHIDDEDSPGDPQLPVATLNLLLPQGSTVSGVNISAGQETQLSGSFNLFPVQPPSYPDFSDPLPFVPQKTAVYNSNDPFPIEPLLSYEVHGFRDYTYVSVSYIPFRYLPASGELYLTTQLTITVNYNTVSPSGPYKQRAYNHQDEAAYRHIQKTVANAVELDGFYPDVVTQLDAWRNTTIIPGYAYETTDLPSPYGSRVEYVIITNDTDLSGIHVGNFVEKFQVFADWKTQSGTPAKVVTVDAIREAYSGLDVPEQIRRFIQEAHELWGTEYVLLGGSVKIVPVRWIKHFQDMPTDLYYSAIFPYEDNWNANGNPIFGQNTIGNTAPDYADYTADIAIGRAPVSTENQVDLFLHKNFNYTRNSLATNIPNGAWLGKTLLGYGAAFNVAWNSICALRVGYDIIQEHHNQTDIYGMLEYLDNWETTRPDWCPAYYDTDPNACTTNSVIINDENQNHSGFLNQINQGYGLINVLDHGGPYRIGLGKVTHLPGLSMQDFQGLPDTGKYGIFLAGGCHTAAIEREEYIGERWINSLGGGVGYYGASASIFATPSYDFNKQFFKSLHNEDIFKQGWLHSYTAQNAQTSTTYQNYLLKIFQLLGDPDLSVYTETPTNLAVTHASTIANGNQDFQVNVSGFPVGNTVKVSLYKEGEVLAYTETDDFPVTFNITPDTTGDLYVTASYTGAPLDFLWTAPGGIISSPTATSAQIQYSTPGTHTINYFATYSGIDDFGDYCEVILKKTEQILVPYIAGVSYAVSCSSTQGMYDLTIYDTSTYVTGSPIPTPTFFLNNVNVGSGSGPITVQVNPGMQHTIRVDIIDNATPGSFVCSKELIIDLLPFPTATIIAPSEACMDTPVPFSANVNDPNLTYLWDFDDFATNSLPDPVRVYSSADTYNVTLTVTNIYGCSVVAYHPISIQENNMMGKIILNPPSACFGQTITLTYNDLTGGINPPDIYHWFYNGNPVATNFTGIFLATQPGEYTLDVENSAGCTVERVSSVIVEFLDTPTAHISGPYEVCSGSFFTLQSIIKNDDYDYAWTRDSQNLPQFNNQQEITTQENVPGTYIYGLEITAPSGCVDTAQFTVTVYPTPAAPTVDMNLISCSQYTVHLEAYASEPGTFIWSDGQSGPGIDVHKGGPYRVTFVNQYGCSSSTDIDVPFNPSAYIWVHPTGCYTTCEELTVNSYLIGPNLPFDYWEWGVDGNPIHTGSGPVASQPYSGDGSYTLTLDNGYCMLQSEPMEWVLDPFCTHCEFEEIQIEFIRPETDMYGNCYYLIGVVVTNPYADLSYNIQETSGNGTIVPGGGLLLSGPNFLQLEFYPNTGFSGGTIDLLLVANALNDEERIKCFIEFSVNLPVCSTRQATGAMDLTVAPNPTSGVSTLRYSGMPLDGTASYSLKLYDISGRLLTQKSLQDSTGQWQLDLNSFANGVYLAVLRKDGNVEGYKRIILRK